MREDPIVKEVRKAGAKIAEEEGFDFHKMAERFRQRQTRRPQGVVRKEDLLSNQQEVKKRIASGGG